MTERQVLVLKMVALGYTDLRISDELKLPLYLAKEEVQIILWRLGANSRSRAVHEGYQRRILLLRRREPA